MLLEVLANNVTNPNGDNCMHIAFLKYITKPFYLEYLLNSSLPLNVENNDGLVPWFALSHYSDDVLFENLFTLVMKSRPAEMNLNYTCQKGAVNKGLTLFHLVMAKFPSYHKLKIFIDFEYNFMAE